MGDASSLPRSRAGIDRVGVACGGREVAGVSPGLEAWVQVEVFFLRGWRGGIDGGSRRVRRPSRVSWFPMYCVTGCLEFLEGRGGNRRRGGWVAASLCAVTGMG